MALPMSNVGGSALEAVWILPLGTTYSLAENNAFSRVVQSEG